MAHKFKLLRGRFSRKLADDSMERFRPGDIVTSETDLTKFNTRNAPPKFVRVDTTPVDPLKQQDFESPKEYAERLKKLAAEAAEAAETAADDALGSMDLAELRKLADEEEIEYSESDTAEQLREIIRSTKG